MRLKRACEGEKVRAKKVAAIDLNQEAILLRILILMSLSVAVHQRSDGSAVDND